MVYECTAQSSEFRTSVSTFFTIKNIYLKNTLQIPKLCLLIIKTLTAGTGYRLVSTNDVFMVEVLLKLAIFAYQNQQTTFTYKI